MLVTLTNIGTQAGFIKICFDVRPQVPVGLCLMQALYLWGVHFMLIFAQKRTFGHRKGLLVFRLSSSSSDSTESCRQAPSDGLGLRRSKFRITGRDAKLGGRCYEVSSVNRAETNTLQPLGKNQVEWASLMRQ